MTSKGDNLQVRALNSTIVCASQASLLNAAKEMDNLEKREEV